MVGKSVGHVTNVTSAYQRDIRSRHTMDVTLPT